jgi:hypothetical protein
MEYRYQQDRDRPVQVQVSPNFWVGQDRARVPGVPGDGDRAGVAYLEFSWGRLARPSRGAVRALVCLVDVVISGLVQHVDEVEERCGCSG